MNNPRPIDTMTVAGSADWRALKPTVRLAALMTRLYGPAPGRRGAKGGRLWWVCPFHDDGNPSFCIEPEGKSYYCFGCGAKGDAIDLVRHANPSLSFPELVALAVGGPVGHVQNPKPPRKGDFGHGQSDPSGLPLADALALVTESESALWSPAGTEALDYLRGRGLRDETVKARRLGFTPGVPYPTRSGGTARAAGIVIPWFEGDGLALVKLRQQDCEPRYAEVHRNPARLTCYPGTSLVRPGRPLVVVEGELDAILLGQELDGLACVVTLGSASARPTGKALSAFLRCPRWYAAHDNDDAGDRAAKELPRAVRVRPPQSYKDWSECVQLPRYPVNLRRWWGDVLAGDLRPPLYTWAELSTWRWGDTGVASG